AAILALQIWGSYKLIRNIFRWLSLTLLAYIGAAILAKPELRAVLRGTLIPTIRFDQESLSLLVAVIGTTLSAYLYTWQSNEEVEEKIARGQRRIGDRAGATRGELAALVIADVVQHLEHVFRGPGHQDLAPLGEQVAQAFPPVADDRHAAG